MSRHNNTTAEIIHMNDEVRLRIEYDHHARNPREECAGPTTVVLHANGRYDFGDTEWSSDKIAWALSYHENHLPEGETDEDYEGNLDTYNFDPQQHYVLPVYMYDHSGITINTTGFSCGWDSGLVGCIYVSKVDAAKKWPTATEAQILTYMVSEVEELDQYLTGEVYGYVIENDEDDHAESCWGYYGQEYCIESGREAAEYYVKELAKRRAQDTADLAAAYAGL